MLSQLQEKGKVGGALTGAQTIISPMWYIGGMSPVLARARDRELWRVHHREWRAGGP